MLWIGSGRDSTLAEEVARYCGLKAVIAAADEQDWKRDIRRCRVVVLTLPAHFALVQEVMAAAQEAARPLPVVILDREGTLDESLVGPALNSFQHVLGEPSPEDISASVSAALEAAAQKGP